ncbi:hypothetical protein CHU98_g2975 [Xylaria longipes]|nr:hypothetical protein CHU98_g2975 [Xylaria longipes]
MATTVLGKCHGSSAGCRRDSRHSVAAASGTLNSPDIRNPMRVFRSAYTVSSTEYNRDRVAHAAEDSEAARRQ